MASMDQVLDLLRRSDRSFQRTQRRHRRGLIVVALVVGPLYLGGIAFAVWGLLKSWQGGDWFQQFWLPFLPMASIAISTTRVFALSDDGRQPLFQPVANLREAIRSGDDKLAPRKEIAAAPELSATEHANRSRFGRLRRPVSISGTVSMLCAIAVLLALIVGIPIAFSAGSPFAAIVVVAICAPLASALWLIGWRASGRFSVWVDSSGMRWGRPGGRLARLAWADVYAQFEVHRIAGLGDNPETQFGVLGERVALVWRVPNATMPTQEAASSAALCRVIAERTGLPLRNVTLAAVRLTHEATPSTSTRIAKSSIASKSELRHRFKLLGVITSSVLVIGLIAEGLQSGQTPHYEHLYAQAQSHPPLLTDPMTSDSGYWPVGQTAAFYGGSYRVLLNNTFYATYELAPRLYDDALIEVDARSSMTSDYQGIVGFMLQGQHSYTEQQFFRTAGSDGVNRIALLIQGSQFTFFLNGRYASGFNDDQFTGAQFGLYVERNDPSFNNFAVYPLN